MVVNVYGSEYDGEVADCCVLYPKQTPLNLIVTLYRVDPNRKYVIPFNPKAVKEFDVLNFLQRKIVCTFYDDVLDCSV